MRRASLLWLTLVVAAGIAGAQEQKVLLSADFEADTCGFQSMDEVATIQVTRDPQAVRSGGGSLEVNYIQRPGAPEEGDMPGAFVLPFARPLPDLKGISFALYSKQPTGFVLILTEGNDGPSYQRLIWSEGGVWQEYRLALEEFTADRDGPPDPNGKLDPESVSGMGIIDVDGFVRLMEQTAAFLYVPPADEQIVRLDDVKFLAEAATEASAAATAGGVALVHYEKPLKGLLLLGAKQATTEVETTEAGRPALKLTYTMAPGKLALLLHQMSPQALVGAKAVQFKAKSSASTALLFSLEEKRGKGDENKSDYQTMVTLTPGDQWQTVSIPLSDLQLSQESVDPDGKLDANLVNMLMLGDVAGLAAQTDVTNTLWLSELVALK